MARSLRHETQIFITEASNKGYAWGENDCALFANNYLVKFFDFPDLGEKFRGKYTDYKGALQTLRENGYEDVPSIAEKNLQETQRPRVGDIALYIDGRSLGICCGEYSWFLGMGKTLVKLPTRMCKKVWRYL